MSFDKKESNRLWYAANKEGKKEKSRKWREANKEKAAKQKRTWYAANKEGQKEKSRKWREANKEKIAKRYVNNREQIIKDQLTRKIRMPWKSLIHAAKRRAEKKKLSFNLTYAWGKLIWNGHCELSGIPFKSGRMSCYSPSIDRINPDEGYTQSNCRFILWGLNGMKGADTDHDIYLIAHAVISALPENIRIRKFG